LDQGGQTEHGDETEGADHDQDEHVQSGQEDLGTRTRGDPQHLADDQQPQQDQCPQDADQEDFVGRHRCQRTLDASTACRHTIP